MCRSIKNLRTGDCPATDEEVRAAALQFLRKVTNCRTPSKARAADFERALDEVAASTRRLLASYADPSGPRPPADVIR